MSCGRVLVDIPNNAPTLLLTQSRDSKHTVQGCLSIPRQKQVTFDATGNFVSFGFLGS